jgi:molybdate transport repressor ModE-like protein
MDIHFDLRWWFGTGQGEPIEPELFNLLHAIAEEGSLRAAARRHEISYRHAWGLMQKWEQRLGQSLVFMERGRGASLTPLGQKLLWGERRAQARLGPSLESLASELSAELRAARSVERKPALSIMASHGLAVALLRDLLDARQGVQLDLQFRGSQDALRLFAQGKCDIAGFHLPEGALGARIAPRFRRYLDPERVVLIKIVRRQQGLMTAKGNPKHLKSVADLAKRGVRFVNRQPGSGTRIITDLLVEDAQIDPAQLTGYNSEEFTHMAVAAMVASGAADAGFGIQAAASRFKLNFIPVAWENYWFAIAREVLSSFTISEVISVLKSPDYRSQVKELPGYDASSAGQIASIENIFALAESPVSL